MAIMFVMRLFAEFGEGEKGGCETNRKKERTENEKALQCEEYVAYCIHKCILK